MAIHFTREEAMKYLNEYNSGLALGNELGSGGTAAVYDLPGTSPPQVVKMIDTQCLPGSEGNSTLAIQERRKMRVYCKREIASMRELRGCDHIMPILDMHEYVDPRERALDEDMRSCRSVFLVLMPKLTPLTKYLEQNGLNEANMVHMAMDVCTALKVCAQHKLLHRDVKPDNIFVRRDADGLHFVLGDFGLCRRLDLLQQFVTRCGTPAFMAPELECGKPLSSFNSDLYSLGSSLYYLLSGGKLPNRFYRETRGSLRKQLEPLPNISADFSAIILKAVQINPRYRYQTAEEMFRALRRLSPDRETVILGNRHFLSVKQAMINGDFSEAIRRAKDGIRNGDLDCRRLLAYCLYHDYRNEAAVVHTVVSLLDDLAYQGDAIAQCIRATIHAQNREWDEFYRDMKESAQAGYAIAQYYYGRALCEGWAGHPKDAERGADFLALSAKADYLPALRFCQKLIEKNPGTALAGKLAPLQPDGVPIDEKRIREDIIRFL